jgi:hypothetical protein
LDKAFFAVHVLGVLLAGLAAPGQNVMWFTDEDSIAANDDRVRELTQLFAWISSQYLTFNLGHCRCGTSKCDDGSRQIEDFLAIPDMIAGALAEQMQLRIEGPSELSTVFWMHRGDFSEWVTLSDHRSYAGAIAEVVTTAGRKYRSPILDLLLDDNNLGPDSYA